MLDDGHGRPRYEKVGRLLRLLNSSSAAAVLKRRGPLLYGGGQSSRDQQEPSERYEDLALLRARGNVSR